MKEKMVSYMEHIQQEVEEKKKYYDKQSDSDSAITSQNCFDLLCAIDLVLEYLRNGI